MPISNVKKNIVISHNNYGHPCFRKINQNDKKKRGRPKKTNQMMNTNPKIKLTSNDEEENIESVFIIGGAQLYNDFLDNYVENIKYVYMTIIYDKKYECNKFIAANIIFNNFKFEKKDVYNSDLKYITMKGYNKGISYPRDEPAD